MSTTDSPRRRLLDRVSAAPTLLGAGSRFEGRVEADGPVVVAGTVIGDGQIRGPLSVAVGAHWQGNVHAQAAVIVLGALAGRPIQRSLTAPSDQNGAFGAYGMSPDEGRVGCVRSTQPVSTRLAGIVSVPPLAGCSE